MKLMESQFLKTGFRRSLAKIFNRVVATILERGIFDTLTLLPFNYHSRRIIESLGKHYLSFNGTLYSITRL